MPVVRAKATARVLIIGQAPGTRVHRTGVPWNDLSGDRLRGWMGLSREKFYDESRIAIMPMGFCYPGKGASGDLPPRPECAPLWHRQILHYLPHVKLTLLIGRYAQSYYLGPACKPTLRATVENWQTFLRQGYFPLVHPSPRNQLWLQKNPWFEAKVIPELRRLVHRSLAAEF